VQVLRVVIIQPRGQAKARAQWRSQQAAARRRANQCETRQVQPDAARVRALVNHDVDDEVLHRRIEIFLYRLLHPMDFVNEKHVTALQAGEQAREVAGFVNHGAAGRLEIRAHRLGEDVRQRRLAQSGRAGKQDMVKHVTAALCSFNKKFQPLTHFLLSDKIGEA
jgi:hypothetical protein